MDVERTTAGTVEIFRTAGRLDSTTSAAFESEVTTAIRGGVTRLVMDFSRVEYVSSAGLRVLLLAAKQTKAAEGGFAIFGLVPAVHEVFQMSGFDLIIPVFESEPAAVAGAGGG